MRHVAANMLSILIVAGLALAGAVLYGKMLYTQEGPAAAETTVSIPSGASVDRIASILEESGAITSATIFRLGVRYEGKQERLKAGEYAIPARASMDEVLDILVAGRGIQYKITVAEGLSTFEILEIVRESELLTGEITLTPAEGVLAPDTYFVNRGDTRDAVLTRMIEAQERILAEAWENRAPDLPFDTPEEALILASVIERETGVPEERPRVGSVFVNRLRRNMPLGADATIRYGITKGEYKLGRGLRKSELDAMTPYNSRKVAGLPPTPIANPGRASIMAAVRPDETDYFYFVADGTGGHVFAETLAEHNRNVAKWREIERQRQGN